MTLPDDLSSSPCTCNDALTSASEREPTGVAVDGACSGDCRWTIGRLKREIEKETGMDAANQRLIIKG